MVTKKVKEVTKVASIHSHGLSLVDIAVLFEIALHTLTSSMAAIYLFIGFFQGASGWKIFHKAEHEGSKLQHMMTSVGAVCVVAIGWGLFMAKDFLIDLIQDEIV